jgi:hypothetical protein
MTSKEKEKITAEAYELLESLLVEFYGKPYAEGHRILTGKIERKFRGKQTNFLYREMFIDNVEDHVETVISRLAYFNCNSIKVKGEKVRNPESVSYKIADMFYLEEMRRIRKYLDEQPIDGGRPGGRPLPLPQPTDVEIESIVNEIIQECYDACVEGIPTEARKVFLAYYPNSTLEPRELAARRRQLANEHAGMTRAQAQALTSEQEDRKNNNLQSKVNKLRKDHVEECVRKCVEDKTAQHVRLNSLSPR